MPPDSRDSRSSDEFEAPAPRPTFSIHDEIIFGKHPVAEALDAGVPLKKILMARDARRDKVVEQIATMAQKAGVVIEFLEVPDLNLMFPGRAHQGVAAYSSPFNYHDAGRLIEILKAEHRSSALVLDHIQDPRNLGAVIRSAAGLGARGVFLPKRRSAGISPAAVKASAGAVYRIPIALVSNTVNTLELLKEAGFWVFGADSEAGEDFRTVKWASKSVLVMGSEGRGLRPLAREKCDALVLVPMKNQVESLNVSVAAGIILSKMISD